MGQESSTKIIGLPKNVRERIGSITKYYYVGIQSMLSAWKHIRTLCASINGFRANLYVRFRNRFRT